MYTLSKSSKTGYTHQVTTIYFEPTANTYAASVLLRNDLQLQDADFLESFEGRMLRIQFSRDTLTKWQKQLGTLFCVYCHKTDLQIEYDGMLVKREEMATLEHLNPISKGGSPFDLDYIVCACGRCNHNRSNKDLEYYLEGRQISEIEFNANCQIYFNLNK